jgi:MFS family permease
MASRRSQPGLDWLNFFVADVQTGFGPFIAVYLTTKGWTEVEIGFALSVGSATMMLSQVPAGALVDAMPQKRLAALAALVAIAASALLLALWPQRWPVLASEVLHGFASCVLVPSIAAISLALVGRKDLGRRLGRNARFSAIGNAVAAGAMGAAGAWLSSASVFWMTAGLTIPSLIALMAIPSADLSPRVRAIRSHRGGERGMKGLLLDRGVLVFAACGLLFTLSNAAMLPLAGAMVTKSQGDHANLILAGGIVVSQGVVAAISPWVARLAESRGRRIALMVGLAALPVRGILLAMVQDPTMLIAVQALDGLSAGVWGVLLPLVAADLTRGTNRFNLCMGLFGLSVGIGATVSTTVAGAIAAWFGTYAAFTALGATGLLSLVLVYFLMPETRNRDVAEDPSIA